MASGVADVNFLKKNSEQTSFIVNVDSAQRDHTRDPSPARFKVTFEEPFRYVYGVSVIDASMPSSMYNIESYNNTFKFHTVWIGPDSENPLTRQNFMRTALFELHAFDQALPYFRVTSSSYGIKSTAVTRRIIIAHPERQKPTLSSSPDAPNLLAIRRVVFSSDQKLFRSTETLSGIAFDEGARYYYILEGAAGPRLYVSYSSAVHRALAPYIFHTDQIEPLARQYRAYNVIQNNEERPVHVIRGLYVSDPPFGGSQYLVRYEFLPFSDDDYVRKVSDVEEVAPWCLAILQNSSVSLDPGNYDLFSFRDQMNASISQTYSVSSPSQGTISFPFTGSQQLRFGKPNTQGDITKTGKLKMSLTSGSSMFFFDYSNSSVRGIIGFSTIDPHHPDTVFETVSDIHMGTFIASRALTSEEQAVIPHGVVYLLGPRYVILRCPEIEAYSNHPDSKSRGLGIFKLAVNQQTVQQRLDFVHFFKKPFHPIERLHALTFVFELGDGNLYDFKGIDMFMIVQVNCYVPSPTEARMDEYRRHMELLNPSYRSSHFAQHELDEAVDRQILERRAAAITEESESTTSSSDSDLVEDVRQYGTMY